MKQFLKEFSGLFAIFAIFAILSGCESTPPVQSLVPSKHYERDMTICVNGVCRDGQLTMPLLDKNEIHIYAQGNLDVLLLKTCGGQFKKEKDWVVKKDVPSGLFGWGRKNIEVKNEAHFTISASDFADTGVCPLNLVAISFDGRHSEGYVNWQTPQYKLRGQIVCNIERRDFEGVEVCGTATGSYGKMIFDEEIYMSPSKGCEITNSSKDKNTIEFRAREGECNYEVEGKKTGNRGFYTVYGYNEIIIRK